MIMHYACPCLARYQYPMKSHLSVDIYIKIRECVDEGIRPTVSLVFPSYQISIYSHIFIDEETNKNKNDFSLCSIKASPTIAFILRTKLWMWMWIIWSRVDNSYQLHLSIIFWTKIKLSINKIYKNFGIFLRVFNIQFNVQCWLSKQKARLFIQTERGLQFPESGHCTVVILLHM